MKKLFCILCLSLLLLAGCDNNTYSGEDISDKIKLEIVTIREDDGVKRLEIDYPVVGGLRKIDTLNVINNSIVNYVEGQRTEFMAGVENETQNAGLLVTSSQAAAGENLQGLREAATTENAANEETAPASGDAEVPPENGDTPEESTEPVESATPASLKMWFKVTWNKHNILNITESFYKVLAPEKEYAGMFSFVFDIANGRALTLADIYDFNGKFPLVINSGIEEQIVADPNLALYEGTDGFTGISKDAHFYLDDNNLYIFYDALDISASKTVLPTFTFPLKKLQPYLNKEFQGRL